jgi:hypothetical protein
VRVFVCTSNLEDGFFIDQVEPTLDLAKEFHQKRFNILSQGTLEWESHFEGTDEIIVAQVTRPNGDYLLYEIRMVEAPRLVAIIP